MIPALSVVAALATADGPVFSADGTLVAHRTDPKLAEFLNEWADEIDESGSWRDHSRALRRAARLAAPAPATDPEED